MSGEKRRYVSVEEQELRRLREQESRLRSVQRDLPERLNAVRDEARREFQQRLAPLEQRARQQEQETQRLKSNLKDLEKDTQRRLQQQRQELQKSVRESEQRQQQALRQHCDLSIMCFSGFTLKQLQAKSDPNINQVLSLIDVLIDGQYIQKFDDNKGWRGSSNQVIHFLTPRHLPQAHLFSDRKRDVEIHMQDDSALMVGLPPRNFTEIFHKTIG